MAAKLKKTCSFRMLATPTTKQNLFARADKMELSGADYIAALIAADVAGRVRWDSRDENPRVATGD